MDGRRIQRIVTIADSEETGSLDKRRIAQPADLFQLLAIFNAAMLFAIFVDVSRSQCVHPRDEFKQRRTGTINVDADAVDAELHYFVQRF